MNTLEKRRKQYGIPETPYLPIARNVLVFRLPMEERTAGGLFIAETAQQAKRQGVLVAAGLKARDVFADHLVEIGDIVYFGRFAGDEDEFRRDPEGKAKRIIELKCEDINGSVDAWARAAEYEIDRNEDGEHFYVQSAPITDARLGSRGAP